MKNSNRLMLLSGVVALMLTAIPPLSADMGMWSDADSNKDGSIDRAEFDAGRASHFKTIDGNGDGFITADEMKAFHDQRRQEMGGGMGGKHGDRAANFLKRLDTSGDGRITAGEWQADSLKRFGKFDSNGDGAVTADELENMHKHRHGKPGDMGEGQMDEGMGKPRGDFKGGLARMDTDKDGKVSVTEWNAMGDKMFARMDDNKDGKISADERPRHHMGKQPQDGDAPAQP